MANANLRRCSKCEEEKSLAEFNKKRKGLQPCCRACQRVLYAEYREKNADLCAKRNKDWYERNREVAVAKQAARHASNRDAILEKRRNEYASNSAIRNAIYRWRIENPEKRREHSARYYEKNAPRKQAYAKKWRLENLERVAKNGRAWVARNREKHLEISRSTSAQRRARKVRAGGQFIRSDIQRIKVVQRSMCACCRKKLPANFHVDHVMPLSLGGSNWPSNLQLLCPRCNLRKGAKHPVDFMRELGFLI